MPLPFSLSSDRCNAQWMNSTVVIFHASSSVVTLCIAISCTIHWVSSNLHVSLRVVVNTLLIMFNTLFPFLTVFHLHEKPQFVGKSFTLIYLTSFGYGQAHWWFDISTRKMCYLRKTFVFCLNCPSVRAFSTSLRSKFETWTSVAQHLWENARDPNKRKSYAIPKTGQKDHCVSKDKLCTFHLASLWNGSFNIGYCHWAKQLARWLSIIAIDVLERSCKTSGMVYLSYQPPFNNIAQGHSKIHALVLYLKHFWTLQQCIPLFLHYLAVIW